MSQITAYAGRYRRFTVTITDENGATVAFQAGDVVRVKIGRPGRAPLLDLDSVAASSNGSTVSAANPATVKIRAADLVAGVIKPGAYTFEVLLVDANDSEQPKAAINGTFHVLPSPGGDTGLT